ncbi:MAG TPA: PhzF family phenazine biosynthesis protein [Candidatus Limnocylindrales bacterium]|nr:PhzF family phenazine biosynthesis protein [Candidatus Limnocylindrales bacterium]
MTALHGLPELHVLRVFVGPDGRGGNGLGVFLDGAAIEDDRRQAVAADLGFAETVFVDDAAEGAIRIFTPTRELAFAGHPTVGTGWLLHETGAPATTLRPPAGEVPFWPDRERTWIRARAEWVHEIAIEELHSAEEVESQPRQPLGTPGRYVWAWIDEAAGVLRSRYFATDVGIVEDEATGAAAVVMGDRLRRDLTIRQGVGSEILVRSGPDGAVEVGGRVELLERRAYTLRP